EVLETLRGCAPRSRRRWSDNESEFLGNQHGLRTRSDVQHVYDCHRRSRRKRDHPPVGRRLHRDKLSRLTVVIAEQHHTSGHQPGHIGYTEGALPDGDVGDPEGGADRDTGEDLIKSQIRTLYASNCRAVYSVDGDDVADTELARCGERENGPR